MKDNNPIEKVLESIAEAVSIDDLRKVFEKLQNLENASATAEDRKRITEAFLEKLKELAKEEGAMERLLEEEEKRRRAVEEEIAEMVRFTDIILQSPDLQCLRRKLEVFRDALEKNRRENRVQSRA